MKKTFRLFVFSMVLSVLMGMVSFADLNQTDRWHVAADGTWYLFNQARTADVTNSWFQDLDGSWYLLAPGDGHMYAGLIHDTLTDRWYFCQTEHDGWYGRMAHTDGAYTVNGQTIHLTFNQQHDGTFGAITSGLEGLQSTGVQTQDVAGIPEDSASATETPQQSVQQPSTSSGSSSSSSSSYDSEKQKWLDMGFTEEEYEAFMSGLESDRGTGLGGYADWN